MKMLAESQANTEVYDELQTIVKKRKLMWFCHISMVSSKDNSTGPGERKMQKRYAEEKVRSCYKKSGRRWILQAWTDARRPVLRPWIHSAEVRGGGTSL